ncbi:MAG: hypothetical protein ACK559_16105, partial [bacterium]
SLVLGIDLVAPCAGRPAPFGGHVRGVDLVADPSEGSHRPVKLLLLLQAISSRPSVLTQGLERLAGQVGDLRGLMDCPLFPVGPGLFLQFPKHLLRRR